MKAQAPANPSPKVEAPKQSAVERTQASIKKGQAGFSPLKPFRYLKAFLDGTVDRTLGGMGLWGRRGLTMGGIAGVGAWMATATGNYLGWNALVSIGTAATAITGGSLLISLMVFGGGALLVGMALGATHGLLTGGMREVGREMRRDRYAADLGDRAKTRAHAAPSRADYRMAWRVEQARQDMIAQQLLERRQEAERDLKTYSGSSWTDRVGSSSGFGQSRW